MNALKAKLLTCALDHHYFPGVVRVVPVEVVVPAQEERYLQKDKNTYGKKKNINRKHHTDIIHIVIMRMYDVH